MKRNWYFIFTKLEKDGEFALCAGNLLKFDAVAFDPALTDKMKSRPIHENLDTSFVNLSALVRYLRRRQFVGGVRVELSGYEADIVLTAENQMKVREHDRIAGRIAEGEEALQRLLIRAREPGGIISVYQSVAETQIETKPEVEAETTEKTPAVAPQKPSEISAPPIKPFAPIKLPSAPKSAPMPLEVQTPEAVAAAILAVEKPVEKTAEKPFEKIIEKSIEKNRSVKLPDFPFELSNKYESKAKQTRISAQDWQMLLNLTGELLGAIDECLAGANLNFPAAFEKSCAEISADYPFLNPNAEVFAYRGGKIKIAEQINAKIFAAGINESLRRILEKLGANPKFAETHRAVVQKILALIHHRRPLYEKFSFTPQLEKSLGA